MSICSLGLSGFTIICKYGIDHHKQQCAFCELELMVNSLSDRLNSMFNKMKVDERPYKCPICEGYGEVIINNGSLLTCYPPKFPTKVCGACEGKGIVWNK